MTREEVEKNYAELVAYYVSICSGSDFSPAMIKQRDFFKKQVEEALQNLNKMDQ
jgi:hypothetical protein